MKKYIKPEFTIYYISGEAFMQIIGAGSDENNPEEAESKGGGSAGGSSMWEWMEE